MLSLRAVPGPALAGTFRPPGDKSITHRVYLLGLLNRGWVRIVDANDGADCVATLRCVAALGGAPSGDRLAGTAGRLAEPVDVLDCGNSGTALRLLAGVVASQPLVAVLSGDDSLRGRPVGRIVDPLRRMGAEVMARDGDRYPPVTIRGRALNGIEHAVPVASAQVLSCVLLAGLSAAGVTTVEIPGPARDHTERLLRAWRVDLDVEERPRGGRRVRLRGPQAIEVDGRTVRIPGDFSAAAFFLALAAARPGARVTARDVCLNPTRTGLLDVLENMGARIERGHLREEGGEPVGDVTVTGAEPLCGFDVPREWVPRMIDEVPAWAVAASLARGRSRLSGAEELRVKESDRLATLSANLSAVGIEVDERKDGLEISGGRPAGGSVRSAGDHRIAMAFATLGTAARAPIAIDDGASIATSFPGFVAALRGLGGVVEADAESGGSSPA